MPGSREAFLERIRRRDPDQPEFLQAVAEVTASLWPFLERHPEYARDGLLERLVEPERVIQFRVAWIDDRGQVQVNRAWRVQHSSAIGPYKGGMRFHPTVNLSILKFLAFEQTFKNALTTLPMGGGKGGADFDPKGRSEGEVMRFCQALMLELYRHLGPDTDVPAGDIGVGAREVGYMAGMMKKLSNQAGCVFTGKGLAYGGSLMRPEATGFGTVYFVEQMLHHAHRDLAGMRVLVSGSGNVAQYAAIKATDLGARVLTFSDSNGTLYARGGFDMEAIEAVMQLKNVRRGRLAELADDPRFEYLPGRRPWHIPAEIALPCATQNELDGEDARTLVGNGVVCVAEGANMPSTLEAVDVFLESGTLYAPGKASNAGGVATSGLEMSQNAVRLSWHHAEVDERLHAIMKDIHGNCVRHGRRKDGSVNYVDGANISGFVKVADAMLAQGVF
ncbi:NADP-specific glutamate dehydrogenase [Pseudoxanthomonas taiwanensis]|jgi:Glutamate dehydrogenase/leucine dehydrogenase|uniref:Glutamate dehydrogenase n=1 Tax=Pseudoxanthomonas taiwanensis TaxID=176598 RepID=A0A921TDI5_9GAMM|nr:NADP-specific glutamate dehydrogenase [Pseudoxanthomonas taiwanensis]KAF1688434.1 NADP-specific glutamate dehydrogenase [Pseudoxanthomonas taiwanensis]MBO2467469.1 NADP-specific glutamate dehydrogenase [Xanthomonadaceae bacterium]